MMEPTAIMRKYRTVVWQTTVSGVEKSYTTVTFSPILFSFDCFVTYYAVKYTIYDILYVN